MASSFLVDPLQLWRDAVTKLEGEVNSLATGSAKNEQVVSALHQFSSVTLGMEQLLEKVIGATCAGEPAEPQGSARAR